MTELGHLRMHPYIYTHTPAPAAVDQQQGPVAVVHGGDFFCRLRTHVHETHRALTSVLEPHPSSSSILKTPQHACILKPEAESISVAMQQILRPALLPRDDGRLRHGQASVHGKEPR